MEAKLYTRTCELIARHFANKLPVPVILIQEDPSAAYHPLPIYIGIYNPEHKIEFPSGFDFSDPEMIDAFILTNLCRIQFSIKKNSKGLCI